MSSSPQSVDRSRYLPPLLIVGVALAALTWAYWATFERWSGRWATDPSYSHGYLVPVFALALLWLRRDKFPAFPLRPTVWGWPVLAVGIVMYLLVAFFQDKLDQDREYSLLPCLAGVCLIVGGWGAWRWAWPAILFLAYMVPLPWRVEQAMPLPLQTFATEASTFVLQTLGFAAVSEGHNILMTNQDLHIAEACSGLRMLMVFFALATALALVGKRSTWERLVLIGSALPIALAANVFRITLTGILYETTSASEWAHHFEHDMAGWLMMPVGLGMLAAELKVLQLLQVPAEEPVQKPVRIVQKAVTVTTTPKRVVTPPAPPKAPVAKAPVAKAKPSVAVSPARPVAPPVVKAPPVSPAAAPAAKAPVAPAVEPARAVKPAATTTQPIPTPRRTVIVKPTVMDRPPEPKPTPAIEPVPAVARHVEPPKPVVAPKPAEAPKPVEAVRPAAPTPPPVTPVQVVRPVVARSVEAPKPATPQPVEPVKAVAPPPVEVVPPVEPEEAVEAPKPAAPKAVTPKVTASPKPAPEQEQSTAGSSSRRARKPWQPAKSSVAASTNGPSATNG